MKTFNTIFIIILMLGASFLLIQNLLGRRKHIPKSRLSDQQKQHLTQYGLLHFTTPESAKMILVEKTIRCGTGSRLYYGVKNYTWYVPCTEPINSAYIERWFREICKMRPNATICIHITIDETCSYDEFLTNKISNHMAHIGDLNGIITAYNNVNGVWTVWNE